MQTKTILSTICCALLIMMSCTPSSEPESPEPIVITADSDTAFQNITTWDTIRCPGMKTYQFKWKSTTDGIDTIDVYTFEISTPGEYDVPTPVEYEGETMLAYAPMEHYMLITSPRYDESGQMIPYYYFTSTKVGKEVGNISVGKINNCTPSSSYARDDIYKVYILVQCTVRITPSENGQDLFECRASVVGADKKTLSYHYIVAPIDYNPLWE